MQTENGNTIAAILGLALIVAVISMLMAVLPRPNQQHDRGRNQTPAQVGLFAFTGGKGQPVDRVSQNAHADQEQKAEAGYFGGWVTKENTPDWVMVFITFAGIGIAIWQISETKTAVLLTERADILLSQIGIKPQMQPCVLRPDTEFSFVFKNFGPTRASEVRSNIALIIDFATPKEPSGEPIPPSSVGGGDEFTITFPRLGRNYSDDAILQASKGKLSLRFVARIDYKDVFGKPHYTKCAGRYDGSIGGFTVDSAHENT